MLVLQTAVSRLAELGLYYFDSDLDSRLRALQEVAVRSRTSGSLVSVMLCVWTLGILGAGCATAGEGAKHGLGAGQWEARLPTTPSPIQELAYGRGGRAQRSDVALDDVLLQPRAARHAAAKARPLSRALAAQQPAPQLAATAVEAPAPMLLAQNDSEPRYAERESEARNLQDFRGGDAIVISAGALVIVLLIVVLILLLR
jgi:hypothetical protein